MKRRQVLATFAMLPLMGHAQVGARVHRIGFFWGEAPMPTSSLVDWRKHFVKNGLVEGRNLELWFIPLWYGDEEKLNTSVREMLAWKPDAILTNSTSGTRIIQRATSTVPVVFFNVADPLSAGFVKNLSRPGGNLTGVTVHNLSLFPKRLQLIRELLPSARRVVVILDGNFKRDGFPREFYRQMHEAANGLGLELVEEDIVLSPGGFEEAFAKASRLRPDFILPLGPWPSLRGGNYHELARMQLEYRIPVLGWIPGVGGPFDGLVAQLGVPVEEIRASAVELLARVLAGSDPAETPVVQTTKVDLVVNLRAARELGIKVPASILKRADRVIE